MNEVSESRDLSWENNMKKEKVIIFDTTLRDGEQTPGASLTVNEKLKIAFQLDKLGVDVIEAGFPRTSPGALEAVKTVAKHIRKPIICGLVYSWFFTLTTPQRQGRDSP